MACLQFRLVVGEAMLAELEFAFEFFNPDIDGDNRIDQAVPQVRDNRIELCLIGRLVAGNQSGELLEFVFFCMNDKRLANCVNRDVIPCRHAIPALIKRRRDISMWAVKDDQRLRIGFLCFPVRIGACYMSANPHNAFLQPCRNRQMGCVRHSAVIRHQRGKVVLLHHFQQHGRVILRKMPRDIHCPQSVTKFFQYFRQH